MGELVRDVRKGETVSHSGLCHLTVICAERHLKLCKLNISHFYSILFLTSDVTVESEKTIPSFIDGDYDSLTSYKHKDYNRLLLHDH